MAVITTFEPGLFAPSSAVPTLKEPALYEPAEGFVIPAMVNVDGLLPEREQPPGKVTVTTLDDVDTVAPEQVPVKPLVKVTVGVNGTVKLVGNVTAKASPAASAPLAEVVKPTVQVAAACATLDDPENVGPVTPLPAPTIVADATAEAVSREVTRLYPLV